MEESRMEQPCNPHFSSESNQMVSKKFVPYCGDNFLSKSFDNAGGLRNVSCIRTLSLITIMSFFGTRMLALTILTRYGENVFCCPYFVFQYSHHLNLMWLVSYDIRYLSIVKSEGLEISQPALDPVKSDVHHPITARNSKSRVHR